MKYFFLDEFRHEVDVLQFIQRNPLKIMIMSVIWNGESFRGSCKRRMLDIHQIIDADFVVVFAVGCVGKEGLAEPQCSEKLCLNMQFFL